MSYKEIQRRFPAEFAQRLANKLYYRYPGVGGESYIGENNSICDCGIYYLLTSDLCKMSSTDSKQ